MNKLFIALLFGLVQVSVFSQPHYQTIRVSNDIEVIKISDNAYVHVSYWDVPRYGRIPSNGLIFIQGNEAFLFDSPMTDLLTIALVSWMKDSMKLKIVGFVPNHWHADCMGGLGILQSQKIDSYANQMTIDIAKSKNLPIPAHGFHDSLQLQLGGKPIECFFLGAAHSLDNIVVWIPSEKILFAGCMVKEFHASGLGNTLDGDVDEWPKTIDKLLNKFTTAKIVIPGHGLFGGLELIRHTRELFVR